MDKFERRGTKREGTDEVIKSKKEETKDRDLKKTFHSVISMVRQYFIYNGNNRRGERTVNNCN